MTDIICRDILGRELEFLTQWDLNRVLVIEGLSTDRLPRFRFSNKSSNVSLVVKPSIVDDLVHVDIPNILLQQPHNIVVSIFYEYDDSLASYATFVIPVIPQKIPDDYEMFNNVDYTSWVEVQTRAELLMHELENQRDNSVLYVSNIEPEDNDVFWFDTGVAIQG